MPAKPVGRVERSSSSVVTASKLGTLLCILSCVSIAPACVIVKLNGIDIRANEIAPRNDAWMDEKAERKTHEKKSLTTTASGKRVNG